MYENWGKINIGNGETVIGIGFPHFIMGKRRWYGVFTRVCEIPLSKAKIGLGIGLKIYINTGVNIYNLYGKNI